MVTSDGRVKIADFGIAKGTAQQRSLLTSTGMTVGTPNYMAPEQAMGQDVGPWTDLYSLGVMAFEFFVGHVPFHDTEQPVAVLMRQVSDPIPPARSVNPEVDAAISNWIERLLAKEPADRVQSAGDAWGELEEIVITLVGPRWRRSARLPAPSRPPEDLPAGPATPPPTEAARPPLMPTMKVPDWGPEAPTRRLDEREDAALARTVMPDEAPTRRLEENGEPPADKQRRRWGLFGKAALLLVVLIVAVAAALGGRSSPPAGSDAGETVAAPSANVTSPDLALRVPRGWSKMRRAPELGLPLARAAAASPGGRAAGPAVEFGMVKGSEAANDALLPASFLSSVGQSADTPPRADRGPPSLPGAPGLALPEPPARRHRRRGDRLHRADLGGSRHSGVRGPTWAGGRACAPVRRDRIDPAAQTGNGVSDRPEQDIREHAERRSGGRPAVDRCEPAEPRPVRHARGPGGGRECAGERL